MKKIVLTFFVTFLAACNSGNVKTLNTRGQVTMNYMYMAHEKPAATVVLFAGGHGNLGLSGGGIDWGRNNFLVRTREVFKNHGFNVAIVDAPSDRKESHGMLYNFRTSEKHTNDIDAMIVDIRKQSSVPVWLVGTSRGTESAAYIGIHSKQNPDGLVLTSSMADEDDDRGDAVTELQLDKITMPVLVMAHKEDGCHKTPPDGADTIASMLVSSKKVELKYYTGGEPSESHPCKALSAHGFLGIEENVIKDMASFIKEN